MSAAPGNAPGRRRLTRTSPATLSGWGSVSLAVATRGTVLPGRLQRQRAAFGPETVALGPARRQRLGLRHLRGRVHLYAVRAYGLDEAMLLYGAIRNWTSPYVFLLVALREAARLRHPRHCARARGALRRGRVGDRLRAVGRLIADARRRGLRVPRSRTSPSSTAIERVPCAGSRPRAAAVIDGAGGARQAGDGVAAERSGPHPGGALGRMGLIRTLSLTCTGPSPGGEARGRQAGCSRREA